MSSLVRNSDSVIWSCSDSSMSLSVDVLGSSFIANSLRGFRLSFFSGLISSFGS